MSITSIIDEDIKKAMKSGDKFSLDVLRMTKSALKSESIKLKKELSSDEELVVLKRGVTERNCSREEYLKYDRKDIADNLQKEIDILNKYLPEMLSDEEIDKTIEAEIAKINNPTIKDMGLIMKTLGSIFKTRADMSKVSQKVKEILTK